jgi:hypothetical protein
VEALRVEALARPGLPVVTAPGLTEQLDPILVPAGDQQLGIEKACVDDMHARQEIARLERRVDRGVTSPSAVGPVVVCTFVTRGGSSRSHVSVRWTL